jgi:hypothetical protein
MKVQEGSAKASGNENLAETRAHLRRWKSVIVVSLAFALGGGALLAVASPVAGLALAVGGLCGLANAYDTMRTSNRLLDRRNVLAFWTGGIVRVVVFALVPVWITAKGPFWAFGVYFAGFFAPLGLYALQYGRDIRASGPSHRESAP